MLARVKFALKSAVAHALYYTGILLLWQSIVLRRKAIVLMYHRVLTADQRQRTGSHPGIVVSRETFARHMEVLRRRFTVLSLEQFAGCLLGKASFPDSSCLITFDDGWRDNLTHALPVMRGHGLPAVVFLPVNFIGSTRLFWRETLTHVLVAAIQQVADHPVLAARLRALLARHGLEGVLDGSRSRQRVMDVIAAQTALRSPQAHLLIDEIDADLGVRVVTADTPDTFIDWADVDTMAAQGISFGGHGADHRPLAECAPGEAALEIQESWSAVRRSRTPVAALSYPNGSLSPSVVAAAKDSGYQLAFTTQPGVVAAGDNPLTLRRINIHEDMTSTVPMFLARIVGLF